MRTHRAYAEVVSASGRLPVVVRAATSAAVYAFLSMAAAAKRAFYMRNMVRTEVNTQKDLRRRSVARRRRSHVQTPSPLH